MPAQLATIPLKLVQPHPKLAFRFRYDVAGLAESIKSAADENTPNGQINPGRVVLRSDGEGYYVYIGVRRYHALKLLYESTKDERFGSYTAYVDAGMTELQMFVKAKRENDEEKGERQGLSVLEEISGIGRIKDTISAEQLDRWLKRLLELAEKLGEKRIWSLYEIEGLAHFRFRLPHLEHLCKIEGERDFCLTAATAAGFGYRGDDMASAEADRNSAFMLEWFRKLFTDIKPEETQASQSQTSGASQTKKPKSKKASEQHLEVHEEGVVVAPCPKCGTGNMVELEGEIKATHVPPDPEGERKTEVTESVSRIGFTCSHCQGQFYLFALHLEGKTYAISPSLSKRFAEPKTATEALDLRYDFEGQTWQKIAGDKVVGPLRLAPAKKKR